MTTVLLLLSLILNIVTILAVIILYLRQNRFFQVEQKQEKMIKELEELISAYLVEMKEENDQFIERLLQKNQTHARDLNQSIKNDPQQPIDQIEKINMNEEIMNQPYKIGNTVALHAVKAYKKNKQEMTPINNEPDSINMDESKEPKVTSSTEIEEKEEESLLQQALRLQNQGISNEEIAKKLDCGKTEIELLLKFNQN